MMKFGMIVAVALMTLTGAKASAADMKVGFVNFKVCVEKSKQGQEERDAFETMKTQMSETLEKTDKELEEMAKKLEDQDYMDGLSPTAEEELKQKFQGMSQEFARYQNQYYQLLQQANYKMLQTMHDEVSVAAEKVRAEKKLSLLLSEDSTFAYATTLDFTDAVIEKMDSEFKSKAVANLEKD